MHTIIPTKSIRPMAIMLFTLQAFTVLAAFTALSSSAADAGQCPAGIRHCHYKPPMSTPRPDKPNQQKK